MSVGNIDAGPLPVSRSVDRDTETKEAASFEKGPVQVDEIIAQDNVTSIESGSIPLPSKARSIALVLTLSGAAFLNTLTVQAVVIVLPTIGDALGIAPARQQWVVSAYSLAFGCFLLLWGRLADVYGKRLIFIYGSAWVAILTLVNPFATNEIAFDLLRGLQGLGGAANVPTAIGILSTTFPPGKRRTYALSCYSAGAPLGSIFGNLLGGLVAQYASWKWIFWILTIFAATVTVAGWFVIPVTETSTHSTMSTKNAVDWVGATLVTVSLLVLLFALTEGNVVGWSTPWVPVLIVIALLIMVVFIMWQIHLERRTTRPPLMKVSVFKNMKVSAVMIVMAMFFSSFNNFLIFSTYFYQEYLGLDAIQTTLRFIPTGVVGIATAFVTSQLIRRIPVNWILLWGMACVALSNILMAVPIPSSTTYWAYGFPAMCLSVLGADTVYPSLVLFTAHSLPREDQALGGALLNAVGQTGRAIGLAISTAIQVAVQARHEHAAVSDVKTTDDVGNHAYLQGLRAAQWLDVALAIAGFVTVLLAFKGAGILGAPVAAAIPKK